MGGASCLEATGNVGFPGKGSAFFITSGSKPGEGMGMDAGGVVAGCFSAGTGGSAVGGAIWWDEPVGGSVSLVVVVWA
jgi:hypothetical protein